VAAEWPQNDSFDLAIRNIMVNSILSTEKKSPMSGAIFLDILSGRTLLKTSFQGRASIEDAKCVLRRLMGLGMSYEIVCKIMENSCLCPSIEFLLSDRRHKFSISSSCVLNVKGAIPPIFKLRPGVKKGFRIVFIDGVIERISEIDRLLQESQKEEVPILLMARKFLPDVVSTLYHNFASGKLQVIPFEVEETSKLIDTIKAESIFSIDHENAYYISSLCLEDLEKDYSLMFYPNKISIVGADGVDRHVIVEIPKHFHKQAGLIEDRVKSGILSILEIAKFGIVLDENKNPICSVKAYTSAKKTSEGLHSILKNLGCIIAQEE